jgi:hypothetical protein
MTMGMLKRRTRLGEAVKAVGDLPIPGRSRSPLAGAHPPKAVLSGLTGVAAVAAASAAVSALRRRGEGGKDDR